MSTSVSSNPPPSRSTARKNRTVRRWIVVFATALLALIVFLVIRTQGFVSGYEFSPTHFQQRRFQFYEIPMIHLQITPIHRRDATPATAKYLRQTTLITAPKGRPSQWHLVSITRGLTGITPADASLLTEQLKLTHDGKEYWRQWSIDHPKQGKLLWPVVQKLAQRELYLLMPALFELAQREQTSTQMQQSIDDYLVQQYVSLIQDLRAAGRNSLADQFRDEIMQDYPDTPLVKQLDDKH